MNNPNKCIYEISQKKIRQIKEYQLSQLSSVDKIKLKKKIRRSKSLPPKKERRDKNETKKI